LAPVEISKLGVRGFLFTVTWRLDFLSGFNNQQSTTEDGCNQAMTSKAPAGVIPAAPKNSSAASGSSDVRRNKNGGVAISKEEIAGAFSFLDAEKTGKVSLGNLKKRLAPFFPDLTAKDMKYLMDGKKELVVEDIIEMLEGNDVQDFDPVFEAYRTYDPENKGHISKEKLTEVFGTLGFGTISAEEHALLIKAADFDGDGVVSLKDFRFMMDKVVAEGDDVSMGSKAASNQEAGAGADA